MEKNLTAQKVLDLAGKKGIAYVQLDDSPEAYVIWHCLKFVQEDFNFEIIGENHSFYVIFPDCVSKFSL